MKRNVLQDRIVKMHNYNNEIQIQCTKAGHREEQKQRILNYGHLQLVYVCDDCTKKLAHNIRAGVPK